MSLFLLFTDSSFNGTGSISDTTTSDISATSVRDMTNTTSDSASHSESITTDISAGSNVTTPSVPKGFPYSYMCSVSYNVYIYPLQRFTLCCNFLIGGSYGYAFGFHCHVKNKALKKLQMLFPILFQNIRLVVRSELMSR